MCVRSRQPAANSLIPMLRVTPHTQQLNVLALHSVRDPDVTSHGQLRIT